MNSLYKKSALWLVLMLGIASAFAWPGDDNASQFALHAVQFRPHGQEQGAGQNRGARNEDGRRGGDAAGRREYQGNSAAPNGGRQSRMTPDERRALRRQIDEAGQDIYRQKR